MSLYSCDFDGSWAYRERIEISDGTAKCCESGIVIPKGQPFAHCKPIWTDGDDGCFEDMTPEELEPHFAKSSYPQCIEVWRLLRRFNRLHGACAPFGYAVEIYCEAVDEAWPEEKVDHIFCVRSLSTTIRKASERYKSGRGPKLHPSEQSSLESGKWMGALPHTCKPKKVRR